jgi:hypothetical protein
MFQSLVDESCYVIKRVTRERQDMKRKYFEREQMHADVDLAICIVCMYCAYIVRVYK